jgi:hypothetical protein
LTAPRLDPVDLSLDIAAGKGLESAIHQSMSIGATSRALRDQPEAARRAVAQSLREALAPFAKDGSVTLGGAIWLVECEAG